jgi:hypothetical protein
VGDVNKCAEAGFQRRKNLPSGAAFTGAEMNMTSLRFLTWGTAAAALGSAVMLSGKDDGTPDFFVEPRDNGGPALRLMKKPTTLTVPGRKKPAAAGTQSSGVHDLSDPG